MSPSGAFRKASQFVTLDVPGANSIVANGINGAGLVRDAQGNLSGTTVGDGAFNQGMVFELATISGTLTTLATFNGAKGIYSTAGLRRDAQGNLFGTTSDTPGGPNDFGKAFELSPVPEPSSLMLIGLGMVGVAGLARLTRARRDGGRSY